MTIIRNKTQVCACVRRRCACMVLSAPFPLIWYAAWLLLEKMLDLLIPSLGSRVRQHASICYHVAACAIPFTFICNMALFCKKFNFGHLHCPLSLPRGRDPGFWTQILFDMFQIYCTSVCKRNFSINIDNLLSYCKIKTFDLWPCRRGHGGGVTFFHAYLQVLGNHGLSWEVFRHNYFGVISTFMIEQKANKFLH